MNKMLILNNLVEPFSNTQLLLLLLVIYIISLYLSVKFDKRVLFLSAIIWLIPLAWFDNILLIVIFVIMFLIHIILPLDLGGEKDEF